MIIIKISEVPNSKEGLRERVRKHWRIDANRLYNQDTVIAVYKGEILEVYKLLGYEESNEYKGRVEFKLEEMESDLKGRKIDYRTANPCTIVEKKNFK